MPMPPEFPSVITSIADLEAVYGPPADAVQQKSIDHLDQHCQKLIAHSPFLMIAASDAEGIDVSPRGGPVGFVRVLDNHRFVIPDAAGNKTTDILHRIVRGGAVAVLFIIPGRSETLRIRGRACITCDPALLEGLATGGKPAELGIGVTVECAFQHCAKAFMRSGLWQPEQWASRDDLPRPAKVWADHIALNELDESAVAAFVADDYEHNL